MIYARQRSWSQPSRSNILEHNDVFSIERVALDLLKVHGLEAPLALGRNLFRGATIFDFGHI